MFGLLLCYLAPADLWPIKLWATYLGLNVLASVVYNIKQLWFDLTLTPKSKVSSYLLHFRPCLMNKASCFYE